MKKAEGSQTDQRIDYYWNQVRRQGVQYEGFNWPLTELIFSLIYTHDVLMSHFNAELSKFNVSPSVSNILGILKHIEGGCCTQQQLSSLLLVSRANITKMIDGLEKRGLVTRNYLKEDRRARIIKLTSAGETLVERLIPNHNKGIARITAGLTKKDVVFLSRMLKKFRASIFQGGK